MSQRDHRIEHSGPFKWDLDEGIRLLNFGMNINAIATRFGVTRSAILKAFTRRGISISNNNTVRSKKFCWALAVMLYKTGKNAVEISKTLNVSPPAVRNALRKTGFYK